MTNVIIKAHSYQVCYVSDAGSKDIVKTKLIAEDFINEGRNRHVVEI